MAGQDTTAHDIHVIEYAELKSEQRTRLTTRDNLGYATVITLHSGIRVRGRRAGAAAIDQGTGDISC